LYNALYKYIRITLTSGVIYIFTFIYSLCVKINGIKILNFFQEIYIYRKEMIL